MEVNERIKKFRLQKKLTQKQFSEELGYSDVYISNVESGKVKVSRALIEKLSEVFGLSSDYILYGSTEYSAPKVTREFAVLTIKEKEMIYQAEGSNYIENYVSIPIARGRISAGTPREVEEDPEGIAIIYREWAKNKADFTAVWLKGESMAPTIPNGSLVGIDHSQKDAKLLNGKIIAIRKGNEATIKRLRITEKNVLIGHPDNPEWAHETVVLRDKEMNNAIIGKVVWWWARQE